MKAVNASSTVPEGRKSKTDMAAQTTAVEKLLKDAVTKMLPEYNGKVFAVGGYVRDKLLGQNPKDIDIVVDSPEDDMEAAGIFAKKLANALDVTSANNPSLLKEGYGIWGVALLHPKNQDRPFIYDGVDISGYVLEITPPRMEGPYNKKREPEYVKYTTLEEDAKRRDLTVNALYRDVASGEIKDYVGGLDDIKEKRLRPPPHPGGIEQIYREDPLRIFRIIRFKGKLPGFKLDENTEQALKRFAASEEGKSFISQKVSKERIREELDKILTHPDGNVAADGLDLMRNMGVLQFVSPTFAKMLDVFHDSVGVWHRGESVWEHTLDVIRRTPSSKKGRLAALLHDVGKIATERKETDSQGRPRVHFLEHAEYGVDMARKVLQELKYPLDIINSVGAMVQSHMAFAGKADENPSLLTLRTFLQHVYEDMDDAMSVIEADQSIDDKSAAKIKRIKAELVRLKEDDKRKGLLVESGGKHRYVEPMNGDEIMQEYAEIAKGPLVGELKNRLKKMLMEGRFDSMDERQRAEEARKVLKSMASKKGWEKQLMQKVQSDIKRRTDRKLKDREKGLPPKAPSVEELI